ncbi:hypothetical protein LJR029_000872 [Caballeronia sp. LjRoot29]
MRPSAPTDALDPQVVQHQQRTDPVAVGGALLPQTPEFPMHAPLILLLGRWDPRDRPHPPFTRVVAHQHRQQLVAVEPIRLRTACPPVHFDTGRVNYEVGDPLSAQPAVQPEAVSPGLIATAHGSISA